MNQLFLLLISVVFTTQIFAQNIKLPEPRKTGGMPLMEALSKRASVREYSAKDLTMQQISDLLWAAFGINRENGKRTAPSARNFQENDLYVLINKGVFTYDAKNNQLIQVVADDIRPLTDKRATFQQAPVSVIIIADLAKISGGGSNEGKLNTANVDAGYISQNIYLYCASEGFVTVARGGLDRKTMSEKLKLRDDQSIMLIHSVGYPKE